MSKIEILTPDGYQPIGKFVKKPKMRVADYYFKLNGFTKMVSASDNHKFQKENGEWVYAKDINIGDRFIGEDGIAILMSISNSREEFVCDIEIKHTNHRYFTNGVSSHNTGGNSLRYYLSVRYVTKFVSTLKEQIEDPITGAVEEVRVANIFKIINIKNKIKKPYTSTKFIVRYGEGFDDFPLIIDTLKSVGVITTRGSFLVYKTTGGEEVKVLGKSAFMKKMKEEYAEDVKKQFLSLKLDEEVGSSLNDGDLTTENLDDGEDIKITDETEL